MNYKNINKYKNTDWTPNNTKLSKSTYPYLDDDSIVPYRRLLRYYLRKNPTHKYMKYLLQKIDKPDAIWYMSQFIDSEDVNYEFLSSRILDFKYELRNAKLQYLNNHAVHFQ